MSRDHHPSPWATVDPPVLRGAPPHDVLTLADLSSEVGLERAIELLQPLTGTNRKAAITTVHYALWTSVSLLIEPFVTAGVAAVGATDQYGLIPDDECNVRNFWVGDVAIEASASPEMVGARVGAAMRPVIDAVRQRAQVGARGLELVVLDSLISQCRQLERRPGGVSRSGWADGLVAATGLHSDTPQRHLAVSVDAGPPVEFPIPRVCCVLSTSIASHACPTCPLRPDDEARRRAVVEWLDGLSDDDAADVIGRRRIGDLPQIAD